MISLKKYCICTGRRKLEIDPDTLFAYHVTCGYGMLWMMKYSCTDCGNDFISGRWLRAYHESHEGTEYYRLFENLYDIVMCPECREYYGHQEVAGSWSLR